MRKIVLIIGILLLTNLALAYDNITYTCIDNSVSMYNYTLYNATDNSVIFESFEPTNCTFGCRTETGRCNPSPYESSNFIIYLLLPIVSFILLYMSTILKEEDWVIHLLLLIGALLFLVVPVGLLSNILPSPFSGLYLLLTVVVTIVIFYYILKTIVKAVNAMRGVHG